MKKMQKRTTQWLCLLLTALVLTLEAPLFAGAVDLTPDDYITWDGSQFVVSATSGGSGTSYPSLNNALAGCTDQNSDGLVIQLGTKEVPLYVPRTGTALVSATYTGSVTIAHSSSISSNPCFCVPNGNVVTFQGLSIGLEQKSDTTSCGCVTIIAGGTLNVNADSSINMLVAGSTAVQNSGTLNVCDATIIGAYSAIKSSKGSITISGSNTKIGAIYYGIDARSTDITMSGGSVEGGAIASADKSMRYGMQIFDGNLTVSGGTVKATSVQYGAYAINSICTNKGDKTVTITGDANISASGPSSVCVSVNKPDLNIGGNAKITSKTTDNVGAVSNNVSTAVISENAQISGTICGVSNSQNGNLTIKGGTISTASFGGYAVRNCTTQKGLKDGTIVDVTSAVTITGGTITASGAGGQAVRNERGSTAVISEAENSHVTVEHTECTNTSASNYALYNDGILRMDSGKITCAGLSSNASAIYSDIDSTEVTISGTAEISGTYCGLRNKSATGSVNMSGGSITATATGSAVATAVSNSAAGTVTITGGTIRNSSAYTTSAAVCQEGTATGSIRISGSPIIKSATKYTILSKLNTTASAAITLYDAAYYNSSLANITITGVPDENGIYQINSGNYGNATVHAENLLAGYTFRGWASDHALKNLISPTNGADVSSLTTGDNSAVKTVYLKAVKRPNTIPTNGSFTDIDWQSGTVGGIIAWKVSDSAGDIESYKVYWGSSASAILLNSAVLYTVNDPAGASVQVSTGTVLPADAKYFLIYSSNIVGNSASCLAVPISDSIAVAQTKPAASFDALNMTLSNVVLGMKYSADGGTKWSDITATSVVIPDVTAPSGIKVYMPGNGTTTIDSDIQTIAVTQADAPAGSDFTVNQPGTIGGGGSIAGITNAMEYSTDNGGTWMTGNGNTIANIAGGTTYVVRTKASVTALKSNTYSITINGYSANGESTPSAAVDSATGKLTGLVAGASYKIDGSTMTAGANGEIAIDSAWLGKTVSIVKSGNGTTTTDSAAQSVAIGTRPLISAFISGTAQVGQMLTAKVSPSGATASYQWKAGTENLGTNQTYIIKANDFGKTITLTATGTGSYSGTVTSNETSAVTAASLTNFTVTYDGGGSDAGNVPTDSTSYIKEADARVMGKGSLSKSGYTFIGWNTAADGTGMGCKVNDTFVIRSNVTLYAQWELIVNAQTPVFHESNVRGAESVYHNASATQLYVVAAVSDGGTLSYQWYKNTADSATDGTPISGQSDDHYTPPTDTVGTTYYYVEVRNEANVGGESKIARITSSVKKVTVFVDTPTVYQVSDSTTLYHITLSSETAAQYKNFTTTLTADSGYTLPSNIIVTMAGATLKPGRDYIYSKATGELTVYNVTAGLSITASGVPIPTQTYTINFHSNGGNDVLAISGTYGTAITLPIPTKSGYSFAGWYRDSGFATSYLSTAMGAENITLSAKWEQITYSVNGNVKDENNADVSGADVKLMAGSRQLAQVTTDTGGNFTIGDVPSGTYNLVISKGGQTITIIITVSDSNLATGSVTLPTGNKNSVVEVKADTPDIVVDKLNDFFDSNKFTADDSNVVEAGGTVEIKLTVEQKPENGENAAANANSIEGAAGSGETIGVFLDLTLSKIVTPKNGTAEQPILIEELSDVLMIDIPLPAQLQGKNHYVIYRYHGTGVQTITQTKNSDGEYIELSSDGKSIKLHTRKFSTYAIAYAASSTSDTDDGGSSEDDAPTITAESCKGGKVTISTNKKTAAITPDEGEVIVDVLVDGKSVGATAVYTFTDSKSHKISAVFALKSALPYYIEDGKKVFIGFAATLDHILKYTAQRSVTVQFEENPKSFTDIENHWAKADIDFVTEREVFLGTENSKFSPDTGMTRAMFVTVIGRLYERSYGSIAGSTTFSDVDTNAYYAKYVAWANGNGVIKGIGGNKFAPDTGVTREEMAEIMFRFATILGKVPQDTGTTHVTYPDTADISDWAIDSAAYCQLTNIITGRDGGKFAPRVSATRAEVSTVVERFVNEILE